MQLRLFLLLTIFSVQFGIKAQDDYYSIKLGSDGGIGNIIFNTSIQTVPSYWVEQKTKATDEAEGLPSQMYRVDPKKAKLKELFGLKVTSIIITTHTFELEGDTVQIDISEVQVSIEIPTTQELLTEFYNAFYDAYAPISDMITWNDEGQTCDQWLADHNNCGILMSLPQRNELTIEELKKKNIKQLKLKLNKGCGI